MSNLEIREFSQAIINFVNGSQLPIEVKRLALADILRQVDSAASEIIRSEIEDRDMNNKEEQDNGTEQTVQPD